MSGHKKYLSVALLSAVLLPAMASAADAPATFTPEREAKIGKIAADIWSRSPGSPAAGEPETAANSG